MTSRPQFSIMLFMMFMLSAVSSFALAADKAQDKAKAEPIEKLRALIIDGQNNHDWKTTTPILKKALESSGRFEVDVATAPPAGKLMSDFKPHFADYDVVVSNYNGERWPASAEKDFEAFVVGGGGFVTVHAADNSFPDWPEYNRIIGVGGWGGRNQKTSPPQRKLAQSSKQH